MMKAPADLHAAKLIESDAAGGMARIQDAAKPSAASSSDAFKETEMSTDLSDAALAEMRDNLRQWASWASFSDAFRQRCEATAALIDDHLAGAPNEAEAAPMIEAIFGELGRAEAERLDRMHHLHEATDDAFERGDLQAWKANFVQLLDVLSEADLEFLAGYFASLADAEIEERDEVMVDMAQIHAMPARMQ